MSEIMSDGGVRGAFAERDARLPAVEVPTLLLILTTYCGWLLATHAYGRWPLALLAPVSVVLITLHSSLQHEILHGHPTRWRWLNRTMAIVPLSFWLPYERYRQLHLKHHNDARLTDPVDDPESFYWTPDSWASLGAISHAMLRVQQTLAGRLLVGSFWRIGMFLHHESAALWRNEKGVRAVWLEHLLWCVPVVYWVKFVCGMPLWIYILAMVIPARGMVLIRSYAEHRALPEVRKRVAIVENSWLLGPLFLFNNLHSLHHETPKLPWYAYNARYRIERARLIAENGGLLYNTYFEVARRYLFRPHDVLLHPTGRVPADRQAGNGYPAALALRSQSSISL